MPPKRTNEDDENDRPSKMQRQESSRTAWIKITAEEMRRYTEKALDPMPNNLPGLGLKLIQDTVQELQRIYGEYGYWTRKPISK